MGSELRQAIRPAIVVLLLMTVLLGLLYPLAVLGIGQTIMPHQANGSLVRDGDRVIGSELIGQGFTTPGYFNSRPSAADDGFDASASAGSNLGPNSQMLVDRVKEDVPATGMMANIPADLVTASGSGLDPHLSPAAALAQVDRVARTRGVSLSALTTLVDRSIERPFLGFVGEPRVNLLVLNRHLDRMTAGRAGAASRP